MLRTRPPVDEQGEKVGRPDVAVAVEVGEAVVAISTRTPVHKQDEQIARAHRSVAVKIAGDVRVGLVLYSIFLIPRRISSAYPHFQHHHCGCQMACDFGSFPEVTQCCQAFGKQLCQTSRLTFR